MKRFLPLMLIIVGIFYSYMSLRPLAKKMLIEPDGISNGYALIDYRGTTIGTLNVKGMNTNNHPPFFKHIPKHIDRGGFFIHPSSTKDAKGVFKFNNNYIIGFDLAIQDNSSCGDIEYIIKKNHKVVDKFIATTKKRAFAKIEVNKGDIVELIANMHGSNAGDWGNLHIYTTTKLYTLKKLLIPFLWSLLFIYLYGKGHQYIAINSYILFLLILFAEKLNFGRMNFETLISYTIFSFALTALFVLIYQKLIILKKFKIATIFSFIILFIMYIIPLSFIVYNFIFNHAVTTDILFAIFQTNKEESLEFLSVCVPFKYIMLFLAVTLIIGTLLYKQELKETKKIENSLLFLITVALFAIFFARDFNLLRIPKFILQGYEKYNKELKLFRDIQAKRKAGKIKFNATKKERGETYIVVIGESLNKMHMGIYGYFRDTTPNLNSLKDNLLIFNKAYSNHVHTTHVLSLALTEANQYNKKNYYNSLSIIDILNKADFETYWITNQNLYGVWDSMVTAIGSSAKHITALKSSIEKGTTNEYDGALIDVIKKVLAKKSSKNRVIFVHLMGSHLRYKNRYPKDKFNKFKELKVDFFGQKASKVENLNDYDNSVYYNDYVVSTILKELQKVKGVSAFIYFSDHGEDVVNKLEHNSSKFTFYMTQIPLIIWLSDNYKNRYFKVYKSLQNHQNKIFSNDLLYDTLIGFFNVKTNNYNKIYDFTTNNYILKDKDALTLHGKKRYTDCSNFIYWQKEDANILKDLNQTVKIAPSNVNTIGKLSDILNDGYKAFEVDIKFNKNSKKFEIEYSGSKLNLNSYLKYVDLNKIKKIYFNFTNINNSNYTLALKRLDRLNNKYNLKKLAIISFNSDKNIINFYNNSGWQVSYLLPNNKIKKAIKENNINSLKEIANSIISKNIKLITFNKDIYNFVKKYIEPKIDINYTIKYKDSILNCKLKDKIIKDKIFLDNRVKLILTPYNSRFN